jgi:hypothetical protein
LYELSLCIMDSIVLKWITKWKGFATTLHQSYPVT